MRPTPCSTRDVPGRSLAPALLFLLAGVGLSSPTEGAQPRRYELDVRIIPDERHVGVSGRVSVQLEKGESAFSFELHEAAHFWWRFGSGQGDWINETFAEYFALVAIREIQGESAFRGALDDRRERVRALPADAPALAVVPAFGGGDAYTIRYEKGALMLEAFRCHLGDEAFFDACRRFYERFNGRSAGTGDFRAFWSEALKDDARLRSWLDSPGRGPVPGQ